MWLLSLSHGITLSPNLVILGCSLLEPSSVPEGSLSGPLRVLTWREQQDAEGRLGLTRLQCWCWGLKTDGALTASWEERQWDPKRHQRGCEWRPTGRTYHWKGEATDPCFKGRDCPQCWPQQDWGGGKHHGGEGWPGGFQESVWRAICYLLTVRIKCEKRGTASEVLKQKKARSCKRKLFLISSLSSWQNTLKLQILKTLSHSCLTERARQRKVYGCRFCLIHI